MGGKSDPPPPPDYTPIAKASEESAKLAYKTSSEQLAWAKEKYAEDKIVTDKVVNSALQTQDANAAAAAADRARYVSQYQPLEDSLVRDANEYASGARKDQDIGAATAQVANQFQQQRQQARANLEAFGIDPSSTRYAALDIGMGASEAAAAAAAANKASALTDATGRALRSEAINIGRGYPGQVAATYGTALQGGNQAVNTQLGQTASGANTIGTGAQWQGLGNQALGVWGNTLNMGYQNQLSAWQANQSQSSGIGSILGLAGGVLSAIPGFEEGGAVPEPETPVPTPGTTDRAPAMLTPGEFVAPKDVVQWLGEKHFHGLIEKARKEKAEAEGRGEQAPQAIPVAPQYSSGPGPARPVQQALPV